MAKNEVKCPFCDALMKFSHCVDFQISIVGSDLPKVKGAILPLDLSICPACGLIQFFASDEIKDSLLRLAK